MKQGITKKSVRQGITELISPLSWGWCFEETVNRSQQVCLTLLMNIFKKLGKKMEAAF